MRNFTYSEYNDYGKKIGEKALDEEIDWIRKNCLPEDIFDDAGLSEWAEDCGFEKVVAP